jgi:predicted oxidoreductase
MQRIKLSNQLELSRIVHGMWRLVDWKMSDRELLQFVEEAVALGVTTFDNADIYGGHRCEELFGKVFKLKPSLRDDVELVTKCGISLVLDKFPHRKVKYYDSSYQHIIESANNSLKLLNTEYIDLLLLHRPDPLINPEEVAKAFDELKKSGKVGHFGVSNYTPMQFEMLQKYTDGKLITNQIEFSPYCLEHFENGNINFLLKEEIYPMVWSPLGGGRLFNETNERAVRIKQKMVKIAAELNVDDISKIAYAWILMHPVKALPIVGSGKIERLKQAVDAMNIELSREQWFDILIASQGFEMA